jgi:hypothetical protein
MQRSDDVKLLSAAFVKAQSQVKGALKDSVNPFFKNKYADLLSVWEACREALQSNALAVMQFPISNSDGGIGVESLLVHESGQWISNEFFLPAGKLGKGGEIILDAQGCGAAVTYARRYALAAIMGVCPEDDDGNQAAAAAAAASKRIRDQTIKRLEDFARISLAELEKEWKSLSQESRHACQGDLQRLKEIANAAGRMPAKV